MRPTPFSLTFRSCSAATLSRSMKRHAARLLLFFMVSSAFAQEQSKFDVFEFRVLGNDVLPQIEVERAVYPFLGPDKSLQDVEAARVALETTYKNKGYGTVFVDIPEQNVENGIVRLRVTEGKLDRIRVQGATYVSAKEIRERLPAAQ